jgi:hypothetical protein
VPRRAIVRLIPTNDSGRASGFCQAGARGHKQVEKAPVSTSGAQVRPELDIHIIVDNYSTQKSAAVQRWLSPKQRHRFHFHFTPRGEAREWLYQRFMR